MTELNITEQAACSCGDHDGLPELDARQIPHAIRHAAVFGAFDSLRPGSALILVAPHDPLPLLAQLTDAYGDGIAVTYLEREPRAFKLKLQRV